MSESFSGPVLFVRCGSNDSEAGLAIQAFSQKQAEYCARGQLPTEIQAAELEELREKAVKEFRDFYYDDCENGRILLWDFGDQLTIAVTERFFTKYYEKDSLKNSIIYLGACESAKDDSLAQTFVNLGAAAVIGNSDSVSCDYQAIMRDKIVESISRGNSLGEALCEAEQMEEGKYRSDFYGEWCHSVIRLYPETAVSITLDSLNISYAKK